MRSALDPLPRSLSLRSLAILVTMLVGGIAISVHEYLESGKVHAASPTARTRTDGPEPTPQSRQAGELGCGSSGSPFDAEPASARPATTCDRPVEAETSESSAPGLWIPETRTTGS